MRRTSRMRHAPLLVPAAAAPAERLSALVPAAHTVVTGCTADMDVVARLCGHSHQQAAELLDRVAAVRTLVAWQHKQDTCEVLWRTDTGHHHTLDRADRRGP